MAKTILAVGAVSGASPGRCARTSKSSPVDASEPLNTDRRSVV